MFAFMKRRMDSNVEVKDPALTSEPAFKIPSRKTMMAAIAMLCLPLASCSGNGAQTHKASNCEGNQCSEVDPQSKAMEKSAAQNQAAEAGQTVPETKEGDTTSTSNNVDWRQDWCVGFDKAESIIKDGGGKWEILGLVVDSNLEGGKRATDVARNAFYALEKAKEFHKMNSNEAGSGYSPENILLVCEDDEGDFRKSGEIALKFVNMGAKAVIGQSSQATTMAALPLYVDEVPQIDYTAMATSYFKEVFKEEMEVPNNGIFRPMASNDKLATRILSMAVGIFKTNKLILVMDEEQEDIDLVRNLRDVAKTRRAGQLEEIHIRDDVDGVVEKVLAAKANVVLAAINDYDFIRFMKKFREADKETFVIAAGDRILPELAQELGEAGDRIVAFEPFQYLNTPQMPICLDAIAKGGELAEKHPIKNPSYPHWQSCVVADAVAMYDSARRHQAQNPGESFEKSMAAQTNYLSFGYPKTNARGIVLNAPLTPYVMANGKWYGIEALDVDVRALQRRLAEDGDDKIPPEIAIDWNDTRSLENAKRKMEKLMESGALGENANYAPANEMEDWPFFFADDLRNFLYEVQPAKLKENLSGLKEHPLPGDTDQKRIDDFISRMYGQQ